MRGSLDTVALTSSMPTAGQVTLDYYKRGNMIAARHGLSTTLLYLVTLILYAPKEGIGTNRAWLGRYDCKQQTRTSFLSNSSCRVNQTTPSYVPTHPARRVSHIATTTTTTSSIQVIV